jgi:hypothetical protein
MHPVNRVGNYLAPSFRNECLLIGAVGGGFAVGGWAGALGAGATYLIGKKICRHCPFPRAVQNIYSTFFGSSMTQTAPLQNGISGKVAPSPTIQKVNDDLYIARRIQDNDLTFILSRLTDDNLAVWWKLQGRCGSSRGSEVTLELWDDHCKKNWTQDQKRFFTQGIEAGAIAFRHTLEMYEASKGKTIRPEIWISYALSGKDIEPAQPIHEGLFPHIEMVLTALTHPDVPVVVHMGIGRTLHNIKSFYNGVLPQHKGLSVPLHSFTAKAILETPQGHNKVWMCTVPAWDMAAILDKALPKDILLKGKENIPIIYKEDGSLNIKNREGQIISILTKEERADGKMNFFHHPEMGQPLTEYTVDYRALANSF